MDGSGLIDMNSPFLFAAADASHAAEQSDLLGSIGIDWTTLALQVVAFLILLWLLRKFVYPPLVAMLDKRDAEIAASQKAARDMQKEADMTHKKTATMLNKARAEADEIVADAKAQSAQIIDSAETRATEKAEAITKKAEADMAQQVSAAKKALRGEMIDLVASATETVTSKAVSDKADKALIEKAIKEAS